MLRLRHALALSLGLTAAPLAGACSTEAKLSPAGGECFQATDCEPGLVCVPKANGSRQCSSDLSGVQSTESQDAAAPSDAAPKGDGGKADGGAGSDGGGASDASGGNDAANPPPQDAAAKDSAPPPQDSAPPPDSAAADAPAD